MESIRPRGFLRGSKFMKVGEIIKDRHGMDDWEEITGEKRECRGKARGMNRKKREIIYARHRDRPRKVKGDGKGILGSGDGKQDTGE